MRIVLAGLVLLQSASCFELGPEEAQCTGEEVFVVDAEQAGDARCADGWFFYTDHMRGPPDPDGGQWVSEELGDLRCHQRCETDADCASGCGRCGSLSLFQGTDYNGATVNVCRVPSE